MLQYLHMENKNRYNKLNEYLNNKFGERTLKICIDAGFTCPNRDGTVAKGGCIFCSERGSGDHIHTSTSNFNSITEAKIGPSIGSHTGAGNIGVCMWNK